MNTSLAYFSIFFLSFIILSLQILTSVFLSNTFFLSFLAVPFTFLGSSIAGVFVYIKYFKKAEFNNREELLRYLGLPGILILLYTAAIKYLPLIYHSGKINLETGSPWNVILTEVLIHSISVGLISILVFLSLGIPYALIYKYHSHKVPKLYFFDLLGASSGCIFSIFILDLFQLSSALILLAFFSFIVTFLFAWRSKRNKSGKARAALYLLSCFLILLLNIKTGLLETDVGANKLMKRILVGPGYEEIWSRWNAYSRASLFINSEANRQQDKYLFIVKNGRVRVYPFKPDEPYSFKLFLEHTPAALGFLLGEPKDILILMAGVGADMIEAYSYSYGASDITGVELNPLIVRKALDLTGYNLGDFFAKKNIHFVIHEARSYVESIDKKFDSIVLSYGGGSEMEYLGLTNPTISYLYTKEAFKSYLRHLKPNGTIVIVSRNKIKVAAVAKAALEESGYGDVAKKIIVLGDRSCIQEENVFMRDGCLDVIVKNADFTKEELEKIQKNLSKMNLAWVYNPYYTDENFRIFEDLLKSRNLEYFLAGLSNRYHQDYSLAKDDNPFLSNLFLIKSYFSISSWDKVLNRHWSADVRRLAIGFSTLSLFIFLSLLGLPLIILPLIIKAKNTGIIRNFRILAYFAVIGMGFIFVELAMIQSFTLFLGNPTYAFSIVLMSLLLATGLGSFLSGFLFNWTNISIKVLSLITFFILFSFFWSIPWLNKHLLHLNFFARIVIILLLIFPIGICLGMFFPRGLKKLYNRQKDLIPLACGINGYASIVASGLAIALPLTTGLSLLILIASILYLTIPVFDT